MYEPPWKPGISVTALNSAPNSSSQMIGCTGEAEALEMVGHPSLQLAAGEAVELALEDEVLAAGRLAVGAVLLADDADRVAHADGLGEHVDAGHSGAPGI